MLDFVPLWTLILGLAVFFYVLLDGFDLGVGMLYRFLPDKESRHLAMNSIAPVWDGNETWLVLGGVGLLAAFPLAFAIIMPAVYFPVLILLLALIFRGVAFEFRLRDLEHLTFWEHGFSYGSAAAAFAQGMVLGSLIQGFDVEGRAFSGSSFDFLTPFSVFSGAALMAGYSLLGACWLVMKTEGALQEHARRLALWCLYGVVIAIAGVSVWTPLVHPYVAERWFSWPNILYLAPIPALTGLLILWVWRALGTGKEIAPFVGSAGIFVLSYAGIAISLWPFIVPYHLTLWQTASTPNTQAFLLIGTMFLLPIILINMGWSYWVFRGKVQADIGYH
jgi:cytochrome d ubiquinol oxidase subunit II